MDFSKLFEIGVKKRNKEIDLSWQELAERYSEGLFETGELYRCWVKNRIRSRKDMNITKPKKNKSNEIGESNYKESTEINKDGTQSSDKLLKMSCDESKDSKYLLKAHGYDPNEWELISARSNIWNSYSKQDGIMQLYSSKITVKPRKDSISYDEVREFFDDLSKNFQSPVHNPTNYNYDGKMLELNVADLHLGKLCWDGDSNDSYNIEEAKKNFFHIINDVITRTKHYKFNKILFVWSNDFFHYDTINQTTTAGTRQDTSVRWQNLYKIGVKMLIEAIDLLSQIAPVETFYIGSNHDKMMSYFAVENIAAWFRNNQNVTIDVDPKIRKYVEFGKCLIEFTHGHSEKKRIGSLMPIEAREAWGRTLYHEVHAAHIHSEKTFTVEDNGIIVRHISSPTGTDNWHYESGYVGAIKKGQSFVWDKDLGLTDVLNTAI